MRTQLTKRSALHGAVCAFTVLLAACSKKPDAAAAQRAEPAVPVLLRAVKTHAVQVEVDVNGTLWGDEDATISAKVAGRIIEIRTDVGDRVAAGDALAQIESVDETLAVQQKELAVKESLAKIALKEVPAADFDPVNVPVVQRAKLLATNAETKFQRTLQLYQQQPPRVTVQDHDDAKTDAEVARSNYDVELLAARAIIEEARTRAADLAIAKQRLADTSVRAPEPHTANGKARTYSVAARQISVGEYVKEGTPLFRLVDEERLKLRAPVAERYANEIKVGQKVRVGVESSSEEFTGEVARINPQIDPQNRSFEVEIVIKNDRHLLHPGAFARARIETHVDPRVIFVPQEALISFAGVNKVFVVEDGKARAIEVEPGERDGDWFAVRTGLAGTESVVVSGNSKLATGVAVTAQVANDAPKSPGDQTPAPAKSGAEGGK